MWFALRSSLFTWKLASWIQSKFPSADVEKQMCFIRFHKTTTCIDELLLPAAWLSLSVRGAQRNWRLVIYFHPLQGSPKSHHLALLPGGVGEASVLFLPTARGWALLGIRTMAAGMDESSPSPYLIWVISRHALASLLPSWVQPLLSPAGSGASPTPRGGESSSGRHQSWGVTRVTEEAMSLSRKGNGGGIFICLRDLKMSSCTGGGGAGWEQGVQPLLQRRLLILQPSLGNPGSTPGHSPSQRELRLLGHRDTYSYLVLPREASAHHHYHWLHNVLSLAWTHLNIPVSVKTQAKVQVLTYVELLN